MGQPSLKTGAPSSDQGLVGRWGRPVLRPGRSEDGAQHIHFQMVSFFAERSTFSNSNGLFNIIRELPSNYVFPKSGIGPKKFFVANEVTFSF